MPVPPRRTWTSRGWCAYFHRQERSLLALPWDRGAELTPEEKLLVGPSLQEFQQGEGLEGSHFYQCAAEYAAMEDGEYLEAHRLFMLEEKRHARDLAAFLDLGGIPLFTRRSLLNRVFCWLGRRFRLETTLVVIVMVEVIAQTYYAALHDATHSRLLRRLCVQILRDEKSHVRFHAERLALLRCRRPRWRLVLRGSLDCLFFAGAGLACWLNHRKVLRTGGLGLVRYWRQACRNLVSARKRMDPTFYGWDVASRPRLTSV